MSNYTPSQFDDIRPYYDEEIPAAMERIVKSDFFALLCSYVYPGRTIEDMRKMMLTFRTTKDFQLEVMRCVNEQVIARSIDEFTYCGVEQLDPSQCYLFVSNHRDIVLDSCLLQYILYKHGHDTTEITFGANLMSSPLVIDIGKSNKMFRVERGGNMKDFYQSSKHLSDYIRYVITQKHQGVWIAQRNGRTKDGIDQTDQGIIKMFCMSHPEDKIEALAQLHIVPVAVSYEWESCDVLKALELYASRFSKYIKKPGEDLNSIITGIVQPKGRVNITLCPELTEDDLRQFDGCTNNEYHKQVAQLIDGRIYAAYKLWPNNYIAHDLLYGQRQYSSHYTQEQKEAFLKNMEALNKYDITEPDVLKDIFLGIYANPISTTPQPLPRKRPGGTLLAFLLCFLMTLGVQAQTAREEIEQNPYLCGSNYLDYDRQLPTTKLSAAPKGYEPFYMSHYGRHGSRWLIGKNDYTRVVDVLRRARQQGKLTPQGSDVYEQLRLFVPSTVKRLGDLTTVGERQHHGIGRRMAQNFPEIFKAKGVPIDARSTVVPRCILSMMAECEELQGANPTARIHNDVSESLQYYLNQPWEGRVSEQSKRSREYRRKEGRQYQERVSHPERLMQLLFNDQQWVADSLNAVDMMYNLFEVASNMQSHDNAPDLLSLFTTDELYSQWCVRNRGWYLDYGAAPLTGGIMPFSQKNLLKNILETADTVVQSGRVQATLRFGHEVCVMPLACLLEMDSCGVQVENLDELDKHWRNYRIFPMACNIQLVFYRPKKHRQGDILVKAMLNERETSLPLPTEQWPYYRWQDVRKYYQEKIARYEAGL